MEGIGGLATMGLRVDEPGDGVEELDDGARPAVGEQQGRAAGRADRAWMKWIAWPSMVVRKCSKVFSRASPERQS